MNRWTVRRRPMARCPRTVAAAAVTVLTGTAVLAGCGQEIPGAVPGRAATAAAARNLAMAANSGCVQATPAVQRSLAVLKRFQRRAITPADARHQLAAGLTGLERLARATPDHVLQQSLANAYDAFTAFESVLNSRGSPAYPGIFSNLAGTLSGFRQTCSVVDPDFATGTGGWAAANSNTVLTRSATAHDARWSLKVANTGTGPATVAVTDSPSWLSPTLKGAEHIALWARALTGTPTITLQVRELSGAAVVGSRQVTMRLDSTFRFAYLTYQVRRPAASRLSVTISAAGTSHGETFLVDNVTIGRY